MAYFNDYDTDEDAMEDSESEFQSESEPLISELPGPDVSDH